MIEDLTEMIKKAGDLQQQIHILKLASKGAGTILVKPRVWAGPAAAKAAAQDWKVRENEELQRARNEIERTMES